MDAHTPGPWGIGYSSKRGHEVWADSGDGRGSMLLAAFGHAGFDAANARLVAAAPDLLAAIKDYMANGGPNWQDKSCGHAHLCTCSEQAARAAIAKAEGR